MQRHIAGRDRHFAADDAQRQAEAVALMQRLP
jgi:hypothetical protein